jgi:hypothetical protein
MTARNLKTRIKKLEASRKRVDETLVVWRCPDEEVSSALSKASYAPRDRVMCLEWYGEGPIPEPKWYRDVYKEWAEKSANRSKSCSENMPVRKRKQSMPVFS